MPLGDRLPHRPLIVTLLGLTGLGLLAAGAAPALPPLVAASALVGVTTVVAPIIGPMAAGLVADDRRGVVSGTLLSGSIGGMLLSRTVQRARSANGSGWRAPYLAAAAVLCLFIACHGHAYCRRTTPPSGQRTRRCWPSRCACCAPSRTAPLLPLPGDGLRRFLRGLDLPSRCCSPARPTAWAHRRSECSPWSTRRRCCAPRSPDGRWTVRGRDAVNLVCLLGVIASAVVLAFAGLGGVAGPRGTVAGHVAARRRDAVRHGRQPGTHLRPACRRPQQAQHRLHDLRLPRRQRSAPGSEPASTATSGGWACARSWRYSP